MSEPSLLSATDIYDIISSNLFAANIENADERMEAAKMIFAAMTSERKMAAPRGGVLLHFERGDGFTKMIALSDPPEGNAMKRILGELADALDEMKQRA